MLIYPSKARNDIDIAICQRPAEIPQAEWTPDKQFQAAMTKLRTSYAPRNETDTTTLRRQLQELSDEIDGGFHEYANQFVRIYTELIKSGEYIYQKRKLFLQIFIPSVIDLYTSIAGKSDELNLEYQTELNENLSTTSISDGFTLRWDNNKNTIGLFVINTSENNRKFEVLFTDEFGNTQLFTNIVLPNYFWVDECNLNLNNRLRLKVICDGVLMIDFDFDKISLDRYKKLYEIYTIN